MLSCGDDCLCEGEPVCRYARCVECGEILTKTEVAFYGDHCDRCEGDCGEPHQDPY